MDWILDAIIDEIEKNLKLYSSVKVGSLPQRSGIAMYIGAGSPQSKYMDKATLNTLYATVNAKHKDQRQAAKDQGSIKSTTKGKPPQHLKKYTHTLIA